MGGQFKITVPVNVNQGPHKMPNPWFTLITYPEGMLRRVLHRQKK